MAMSSHDDDDDAKQSLASNVLRAINGIKYTCSQGVFGSLFPSGLIDVGLSIESIRTVALPLLQETAQSLLDLSQKDHQAHHNSKLHQTIPRNFWLIVQRRVSFNSAWDNLLSEAVNKAQNGLAYSPEIK
jgi:hypothetical protein